MRYRCRHMYSILSFRKLLTLLSQGQYIYSKGSGVNVTVVYSVNHFVYILSHNGRCQILKTKHQYPRSSLCSTLVLSVYSASGHTGHTETNATMEQDGETERAREGKTFSVHNSIANSQPTRIDPDESEKGFAYLDLQFLDHNEQRRTFLWRTIEWMYISTNKPTSSAIALFSIGPFPFAFRIRVLSLLLLLLRRELVDARNMGKPAMIECRLFAFTLCTADEIHLQNVNSSSTLYASA